MSRVLRSTPMHTAWLLPAGTLFFMCGILLGSNFPTPVPALAALALSILAALVSGGRRRAFAILLAALTLGAVRSWQTYHPILPEEGSYTVRGTVVQEIILDSNGQAQTILSGVTLNGQSAADAYWTFYLAEGESLPDWLAPGVQVELTARVYHPQGQQNPGGFDFRCYLLQQGMQLGLYGAEALTQQSPVFSLRGSLAALRHSASLQLLDVMGEEAGAYAAAMLLGTRDFLPEDDRADFQTLGISHILSVSGYHVGVLAWLLMLLLRPLPLGRRSFFGCLAVALTVYCLFTGGNAPVIRAAGLLLWREFTRLRNRQNLPLHTLCVTALAQLAYNPALLLGASFQLTYGAMLGLLLVFPWLKRRVACAGSRRQRLWEAFAAALSVQLGILLPQLYWFGELPLFSVLLNMAVMTLAGALMLLYWVTLALLWVPGLRTLLGTASAAATSLMLYAVRLLADMPLGTLWTRQADTFTFAGWLILLLSLSFLLPRRLARYRARLSLLGGGLILLLLLPLPQNQTSYTQFSVGNGDAAILQDASVTVVIDLGADGQTIASYLHQRRQTVELLILTHLHTDHAGGLRALLDQGIPVEVCCLPVDAELPGIDSDILDLLQELAATGTEFRTLCRGDVITLPGGSLTVLWPVEEHASALHDANDVCLVLHGTLRGTTLLLTGDLSSLYESHVALPADILKVAHHGSADATSEAFVAAVKPQVLLLSNRSESRETRMAELAGELPLYSTCTSGAVTLRFTGSGIFDVIPWLQE